MIIYHDNIRKYSAKLDRLQKKLNLLSIVRLLFFIVSLTILFGLFSNNFITPTFVVLPVTMVCFAFILKYYSKTAYERKHTLFLKKINENEILKREGKLSDFETGQRFIDPIHPYTSDLDVFGQHSLFQLVNRTTTESGTMLLAQWLSQPAPNQDIHNRQNAIKELTQKPDWRQDFQANGMHFENKKSDYSNLLAWVKAPNVLYTHRTIYTLAAIVLSALSLMSIYIFLINAYSPNGLVYLAPLILVVIVNYIVLRKVKPTIEAIVITSQKNIDTLKGYQSLIKKIEDEDFQSEKLVQLKSILAKSDFSASKEIKKLCKLLDFSQQRGVNKLKIPVKGNPFYLFINNFLLLDIYVSIGVEKWKFKNQDLLGSWAEAVSEFEVINSFAGFSFSNPTYAFPEISEQNNAVDFEQLGHPLVNSNNRVCNDFHLNAQGDIVMITGSNMGGKSTFLRTVGINLVLALAGAPCCAKRGKVSNLKLFTSMRTQDNLAEGVSSFYAELGRMEKLLKLMNTNDNVFFLLDEIFKGTNSKDRHKGGFSLINQISKLKTSGIIATHDIELATLAERKNLVTNYSFNSKIEENSMLFSYKLEPGICVDFNASELMKRSGIHVIKNISDQQST